MNTVPNTEGIRRAFRPSQNLVRQLIQSQTGSLSKAVLELVCNAIDAGAHTIDVVLDRQRIEIRDDGRGFGTLEEIEHHFEEFGFDHDTERERARGRIIGRFGLGRGQIMSYGLTRWETGQYEITVDVRDTGTPSYVLNKHDGPPVQGCRVTTELFKAMGRTERARCTEDIEQHLKWAPGTIRIDGAAINEDPEDRKQKWTARNERLYFKEEPNQTRGIDIYSQGVYVENKWHGNIGVSGSIVSKVGHPFDLNMARNEIKESCPLWQEALSLIRVAKGKRRTHGTLNDIDREAIWTDLRLEAMYMHEAERLKILPTINNRYTTWRALLNRWKGRIAVAPRGSTAAEAAHRNRDACVLDPIMLEWTRTRDVQSLAAHLNTMISQHHSGGEVLWTIPRIEAVDLAELCAPYEDNIHIVERPNWRIEEADAMAGLKILGSSVARALKTTERKLILAQAQGRLAWTDGKTWIAFDRTFLTHNARRDANGWNCLLHIMLHEYIHVEQDEDAHAHPPEFYEQFHDTITSESWEGALMVLNAMRAQLRATTARGKRTRPRTLAELDIFERVE